MKKLVYISFLSFLAFSCTKDFEEINTNPTNPTKKIAERDGVNVSGYLGTIQNQIIPTRVIGGTNSDVKM